MAQEKKYIALHQIPLTTTPGKTGDKAKGIAPTRPKVVTVMPGEPVMLKEDDPDTKFLLDNKAIKVAPEAEGTQKAPAKKAPAKKAPAKSGGGSSDDGSGSSDDGSGSSDDDIL